MNNEIPVIYIEETTKITDIDKLKSAHIHKIDHNEEENSYIVTCSWQNSLDLEPRKSGLKGNFQVKVISISPYSTIDVKPGSEIYINHLVAERAQQIIEEIKADYPNYDLGFTTVLSADFTPGNGQLYGTVFKSDLNMNLIKSVPIKATNSVFYSERAPSKEIHGKDISLGEQNISQNETVFKAAEKVGVQDNIIFGFHIIGYRKHSHLKETLYKSTPWVIKIETVESLPISK